jgi:hypothetical protein
MNRTGTKLIQAGQPHERRHPLEGGGVKITTFIPLQFKKRGVKKVVISPVGVDEPVMMDSPGPAISPTLDPVLLKALGRGFYWQHLLDKGVVADAAEIARREGLHKTTINNELRFALLAPEIIQAAMDGRLPRTVSLESLQRTTIPVEWGMQWEMVARPG